MSKLTKRGVEARTLIAKWLNDRFYGRRSTRRERVEYGRTVLNKCPGLTASDVTALNAFIDTTA